MSKTSEEITSETMAKALSKIITAEDLQKKWFSEDNVKEILAPIYEACNDQRPFEIQRLISDKVKELKL